MTDTGPNGERRWFLLREGRQFGPFTWADLGSMARDGRVSGTDVVWAEHDAVSRRARDLPGLVTAPWWQRWWLPAAVATAVVAGAVLGIAARGGGPADDAAIAPDPAATLPQTPVATAPVTSPSDDNGEGVGVGVAEIVAPDEAALLVDAGGGVVPGDQVLFVLQPGSDRATAQRVAAVVGGEVVGRIDLADVWQVRIAPTTIDGLESTLETLRALDEVALASANATATSDREIHGERLDPMRDPPYDGAHGDGFRMIGVEQAWQYLRASGLPRHPVRVGITDDGLYRGPDPVLSEFPADRPGSVRVEFPDPDAGEIDPANVPARYTNKVASGEGSHGTGVLTVMAGNPADGGAYGPAGILGEDLTVDYSNVFTPPYGSGTSVVPPGPPPDPDAPTTTTAPIEHVQWSTGVTYTTGQFKAIADQVRNGARVINMSWGCDPYPCNQSTTTLYRQFFEQLAERHPDVLFVAAAGNDGASLEGTRTWPGGFALPNMITVGNLENDGTTRASSNRASANHEVTLAAPGNNAVRGIGPDGTPIADRGGTSNAAPQVTAAAALLLSIKPDLTAAQIKDLLARTARTTITRPDDTTHDIDPGVGGRVLAIDRAVFELIRDERLRLGLDQPNPPDPDNPDAPPTSGLTEEHLANLGVIDAVATETEGGWLVRATVSACAPACTSVSITTSDGTSLAGSTTQTLTTAGDVTWSATLTRYPTTITVRRNDNGAGNRIFIPEEEAEWTDEAMARALSGLWRGSAIQTLYVAFGVNFDDHVVMNDFCILLDLQPDGTGTASTNSNCSESSFWPPRRATWNRSSIWFEIEEPPNPFGVTITRQGGGTLEGDGSGPTTLTGAIQGPPGWEGDYHAAFVVTKVG